jgi:hypothetical protein
MQNNLSRRALINHALLAVALIPAVGIATATAAAAGLVPLDPNEPAAKPLGYVTDSSKVDAAANPTFKADQKCANCAQFQGKASDAQGGCNLFAGKSVTSKGWCKAWAKKAGA